MNGRVKPRFEDLANAALQKPTYTSHNAFVPPGNHEMAIADFRNMSQDLKRTQYDASSLLATAQQIAQARNVSVEIALGAMAHEQSGQATQRDMTALASSSAAGQDRYDLLNQDNLLGQMALKFRHTAQLNDVAQQVRTVHNPFRELALRGIPQPSPAEAAALTANAASGTPSQASGTPPASGTPNQAPNAPPASGTPNQTQSASPERGLQATADAVAAAEKLAIKMAVPDEDDVIMVSSTQAAFTTPAFAPKNYEQLQEELRKGLQLALGGETALLFHALQHTKAWLTTAQL